MPELSRRLLLSVSLSITISTAAFAQGSLVGRWDLTMQQGSETFPGWLEVSSRGGTLAGRMQGRYGSVAPVVQLRAGDGRFEFVWPPDRADGKGTRFAGTLDGDRLTGSLTTGSGDQIPFNGVRAPSLTRTDAPIWGQPVDLLAGGLSGWRLRDPGDKMSWTLVDGVLTNHAPGADLVSLPTFTDFKLHIEFKVPEHGNSGVYLRGRHEVQVEDSYGARPDSLRLGGIFGQVTPTTLPARKPGEWQSFDITLLGRTVTVVLNGVMIIDRIEIPGITGGALDSEEGKPGPLMLQGDHTAVSYRRILLTPAKP